MKRLSSVQISATADTFGEELILSETSSPVAMWTASGDIKQRFSEGSIWLPELNTGSESAVAPRLSVFNQEKSIFFIDTDGELSESEFSNLNNIFNDSEKVEEDTVDLFAVPERTDGFKVVYTKGSDIFLREKNGDIWGSETLLVSEISTISSISMDNDGGYDLVSYTNGDDLSVFSLSGYGAPITLSHTDELNNVVVRLSDTYNFDLVYEKKEFSGRSIQHLERNGLIVSSSEIIDATDVNYNPDIFIEDDKEYVTWLSGGYVRYRERDGLGWVGLDDSAYVDSADSDSEPKIIFSSGYPRILYKKDGAMFYNGLSSFGNGEFSAEYSCSSWGATKLASDSNSATSDSLYSNKISQRIIFRQEDISIGGVSCFIKKYQDDAEKEFTVSMDVFYADKDGNPYQSSLGTSTISSTLILKNGWYEFDFVLEDLFVPLDGICFVASQTDGDEDNYFVWSHTNEVDANDARISSDGVNWEIQSDVNRSLRVRSDFDAFEHIINDDPGEITNQLVTPPAAVSTDVQITPDDLLDGTFDNTELAIDNTPGYQYGYGDPTQEERIYNGISVLQPNSRVVLKKPNVIMSMIVDSSGSSGWTDVSGFRKALAKELVEKMEPYEGGKFFDVVHFGGLSLDGVGFNLQSRSRGVFVDVKSFSGFSGFDEDGNPLDSADLFNHLSTGILSYGFKDLKPGTDYAIKGFDLGWTEVEFTDVASNWHNLWSADSPTISVDAVGPEGSDALKIQLNDSSKDAIRYSIAENSGTSRTFLSGDVTVGDVIFPVVNNDGFEAETKVLIGNKDQFNGNYVVELLTDVPEQIIVEKPVLNSFLEDGSFVETYDSLLAQEKWERTDQFQFFVLDSSKSGKIKFYVQTANGAHIEWEFEPLETWQTSNLYFLDETAPIQVNAVNSDDEPVPDGTTVEFFVDKEPTDFLNSIFDSSQKNYDLIADSTIGSNVIKVDPSDAANISRGISIDVIDDTSNFSGYPDQSSGIHRSTVTSVDTISL